MGRLVLCLYSSAPHNIQCVTKQSIAAAILHCIFCATAPVMQYQLNAVVLKIMPPFIRGFLTGE